MFASKSEERLHKIKEEIRIKYERTGLMHATCKKCGLLPINMFYVVKRKKIKDKPMDWCKKMSSKSTKVL